MTDGKKNKKLDEILEHYKVPELPDHLDRNLAGKAYSSAHDRGAWRRSGRGRALMWIPAVAVAASFAAIIVWWELTPEPSASPRRMVETRFEERADAPLNVTCVDPRKEAECRRTAAHQGLVINGDLSSVPKYEFLMAREFVRELTKRR